MDTPMTENDVRRLENMSASCLPLPLDDVMVQIASRARALLVQRDTLAARVKELEAHLAPYPSHLPERPTLGLFAEGIPGAVSGTAVNPAKPGLLPMKCPCGGKIEFGRERVGHCMTCGASCRVMDPPPATGDEVNEKVGQYITLTGEAIPVPGHYFSDDALLSTYADGYLAGKRGAK